MKRTHLLPALATLTILAGCALALAACGDGGLLGVDAPAPVRRFLGSQPLGQLRGYDAVLTDRASNLVVFRVSYGEAGDCTLGCEYPKAYGLAAGDRVGWLDGPDSTGTGRFDVVAGDTAVFGSTFRDSFLPQLRQADGDAWNALLLRLASDKDTPPQTLLAIATLLHDGNSLPAIGVALLANPVASSSFDVLSALAQINTWIRPPWYPVIDSAWARLAGKVPPLSALRVTGTVLRSNDLLVSGVSVRNAATAPTLLRYPALCDPLMQLYRDSTLAGPVVWDAGHWWWYSHAGGCKLPGTIRLLAPGDSARLSGPGFRPTDVLGDSLLVGRYWAVVPLPSVSTPAGALPSRVPAGPLDLSK